MGKKKTKLPKRILGAKMPKDARKRLNRLLRVAPAGDVRPIVAGAVAIIATLLADRLEGPLADMLARSGLDGTKSGSRPEHGSFVQH